MTPEFARPFRLDELGTASRAVQVEADQNERAALAERFGLLSVESLQAEAELVRLGDDVSARGHLRAAVTQACVATGEPVPATVYERFTLRFVPEPTMAVVEGELELGENDLDSIEYQGSAIDLGEALAQTLALGLDPFPRAAGATDKLREAGVLGEEDGGPFAILKALKDKL